MKHEILKHTRDEHTGFWTVACTCGWTDHKSETPDDSTLEFNHHVATVSTATLEPSPRTLLDLQAEAYVTARNKGWWDDQREDGGVSYRLVVKAIPEKLALIHSEVSEALEDYRTDKLETEHNPLGKPEGFPTELADIVIRVMDLAGALGIDLQAEVENKLRYNRTRSHRHGGKRC